tara:strand:+ start:137 stop:484 length:348 start_codon:yes stop_codon:yes gene_type:complete
MVTKFIKKKLKIGGSKKPKPKPKPKKKAKKKATKLTAAERAEQKEARAILQSLPPGVRNSMRKAMADRKAASKLKDQQLKKAAQKKAEERMNKLTGQMLYGSMRSNTFKRGGRAR